MIYIIIGLIAVLLCPSVVFPFALLGYITSYNSRSILRYCFILSIFFAILGFCFKNPASDPDLVRYLAILAQYEGKSLFESFNLVYSNLYAVDIVFWMISQSGSPQLLPAFACFIYYFVILYILGDYKVESSIRISYFVIYLLFTIASTLVGSIINGIRWPMAFSLFLLAIYCDLYKNKKNVFTFILYIISFFMHFSVIGLIAVRLLMILKNKKIVITLSLLVTILPQLISALASKIGGMSSTIGIINSIIYFINRSNMYFKWDNGGWVDIVNKSSYYKIEKYYYIVISAMLMVILILAIKKYTAQGRRTINDIQPIYIFSFTYIMLTFVTFLIASHVYIRFVTPAIPLFSIMTFDYCHEGDRDRSGSEFLISKNKLILVIFLTALAIVGFYLNHHFLSMMIDTKQYTVDIFLFNVFKLFE